MDGLKELQENSEQKKKEPPFGVWIGNLRKYTEGDLEGEWIYFPMEEEKLKEAVNKIAGPEKDELMIFDIDIREDCGFMRELIGDWSYPSDLNVIAKLIGDQLHPAVEAYLQVDSNPTLTELANLFMQESEIPYYPYEFEGSNNPEVMERLSEEEKMGYSYIANSPELHSVLENLQINETIVMNYLDVEAIGRDLSISEYSLTENGYYNFRQNGPDLSAFTMDEIKEELAKKEQEQKVQQEKEETTQMEKNGRTRKEQQRSPSVSPSL